MESIPFPTNINKESLQWKRPLVWIGLGSLSILLKWGAGSHPQLVEEWYSRWFFQFVRIGFDHSLGLLPFPAMYLLFLVLVVLLSFNLWQWWRKGRNVVQLLLNTLAFFAGLIFFFFLLWGYNYDRQPIEKILQLQLEPTKLKALRKELERETRLLSQQRLLIEGLGDSVFREEFLPENLESALRSDLEKVLQENAYPVVGRVRGRFLYPKGIFLRFSSAGLYLPFTGEGHIDGGLHPVQWPFIMTHELAHGYGFAEEGTCNFWAYVACSQSTEPAIAYAGRLSYWRTLAIQYKAYEPEKYEAFRKTLPPGIVADLDAVNATLASYPDFIPNFQNRVYDAYLKTQGIPEGILSYNRVIMLVRAWNDQHLN